MVLCQLLNRLLVSLSLYARVPVVLQDVLLLHLEGPHALLGKSLLVLELLILSLQELVGLSGLCEFVIDELIFSSKRLNIFAQLSSFSRFHLNNLVLVLKLLPEVLIFLPQVPNFVLALKESSLKVILFACNHGHLMLHVAKIKYLFL